MSTRKRISLSAARLWRIAALGLGMLALFGCAAPRPPPASAPPSAVVLELMQRLARANEAYRKITEARSSVMIALQGNDKTLLESRFADVHAPTTLRCPAEVRHYASRLAGRPIVQDVPLTATLDGRQRRLARGLILLDSELRRAGHRHADCAVPQWP